MTIRTDIDGAPVLTGPWPDPVVPDTSLPEFLLATATQQAERAAIIDASSGRTLHYAELADGVRRVRSRRPRPRPAWRAVGSYPRADDRLPR